MLRNNGGLSLLSQSVWIALAVFLSNGALANSSLQKLKDLDLIAAEVVSTSDGNVRSELRLMSNGKIVRLMYDGERVTQAFVADEIIVGLKDDAEVVVLSGSVIRTSPKSLRKRFALIRLDSTNYPTLKAAIKDYRDSNAYRYVQKNYLLFAGTSGTGISGGSSINGELPFQPLAIHEDGTKESWFGNYRDDHFPWIRHAQYGDLYVRGMNPSGEFGRYH